MQDELDGSDFPKSQAEKKCLIDEMQVLVKHLEKSRLNLTWWQKTDLDDKMSRDSIIQTDMLIPNHA